MKLKILHAGCVQFKTTHEIISNNEKSSSNICLYLILYQWSEIVERLLDFYCSGSGATVWATFG